MSLLDTLTRQEEERLQLSRLANKQSPPTEMASLREIKQRLAAIEQGQGVICERLDMLAMGHMKSIQEKLDAIQGELLVRQFQRNELLPKDVQEYKAQLHAKFGFVKGLDGKCACAYCVRNCEALMERCAEHEMEAFSLQQKLDELLAQQPGKPKPRRRK